MASAAEHYAQVKAIVGMPADADEVVLRLTWEDPEGARREMGRLRNMQKELLLAKKNIQVDITSLRSEYLGRKAKVGAPSLSQGLMRGLLGARSTGKINTLNREAIRQQQFAAVQPYEEVKRIIDRLLLQIDQAKLQLDEAILK